MNFKKFFTVLSLVAYSTVSLSFAGPGPSANSTKRTPINPVNQVIHQDEIHLALPAWEASALGFTFQNEHKRAFLERNIDIVKGIAVGVFTIYSYIGGWPFIQPAAGAAMSWGTWGTNLIIYFTAVQILSLGLDVNKAWADYYYGSANQQNAARLVVEHGDKVCMQNGFRRASVVSGYYLKKLEFIKPIHLEAKDFDKFKVYLDGERLTSEKAEAFLRGTKDRVHHQFNTLYCE